MFYRKFLSLVAAFVVAVSTLGVASAKVNVNSDNEQRARALSMQTIEPLNLAVLIQDDLVPQVGNELKVTREFIRSLPEGSRVMVGYITSGALQVRQPFTTDLDKAAKSLRVPIGSTSASPFNPYVEVIDAIRKFERGWSNANAVLLISDGLDTSRGFDSTAAGHTLDIERTISEANKRNVAVFSFYAPSVGLTSRSRLAASYGQSSLNRVSNETGGRAFFQGTTGFVTFDPYFDRLRETLNRQYARAR
ncbi:MAG TPA: hypothetical protein VFS77_07135 [Pyrinomonadaceae bacterium]|nr:hypothetical protein [Pyrinomonadaceae bacterium]